MNENGVVIKRQILIVIEVFAGKPAVSGMPLAGADELPISAQLCPPFLPTIAFHPGH